MQMTSSRRGVASPTVGPTDPYAEAHIYYGAEKDTVVGRSVHRTRTLSSVTYTCGYTRLYDSVEADR